MMAAPSNCSSEGKKSALSDSQRALWSEALKERYDAIVCEAMERMESKRSAARERRSVAGSFFRSVVSQAIENVRNRATLLE
mmetsp:Transcript_9649/g.14514  ORF Transcript_9649/g.14514 Transcript_9649/m.14514 type:complete len:82 (-) Transcript_9649:67-312(-)